MCDLVLRGLIGARLQPVDLKVVKTLSSQLFEGPQHTGQDLIARNIARGRDHGLPPYVQYREACGGPVTTSFDDLLTSMPRQAVHALARTYARVEDVDLFVGGLAEFPVSRGLVGPTFACLIGYQFFNLRRGDRFWYENADAGFTPAQLRALRSASTLNRLLCDNFDGTNERLPASIFHLPSQRGNPLLPCDHLTPLDLSPWKEHYRGDEVECEYLGRAYAPGRNVHVSHCLVCVCQAKGLMRCQPNPSGCQQPDHDEHCRLIC
ncbi:peroxidase-like protein 3 [Eriocheir sinensis]|uniref:peroxidase-like protein 3 n=1 Tax=Eriocheir sinensis TaxID=95602 RepID=UPI0021C81A3C|nr:peroxidase-like protein 3 [Eriocheir sinensis]